MKSINERIEQAERILDRGKNRKCFNGILLGTLLALSYPNLDRISEYKVPSIQEFREEIKKPSYNGKKDEVFSLEAIADEGLKSEIEKKLDEIESYDFKRIIRKIDRYNPIIESFSEAFNIDHYLIAGVMYQESNGNKKAISSKGAMGLMQVTVDAVKDVIHKYSKGENKKFAKDKIFIPEYNIEIGTRYLSALIDMYKGNVILGLAAYNMGPTAVNEILKMRDMKPEEANWHNMKYLFPRQTREYIPKVFSKVLKMRENYSSNKENKDSVY